MALTEKQLTKLLNSIAPIVDHGAKKPDGEYWYEYLDDRAFERVVNKLMLTYPQRAAVWRATIEAGLYSPTVVVHENTWTGKSKTDALMIGALGPLTPQLVRSLIRAGTGYPHQYVLTPSVILTVCLQVPCTPEIVVGLVRSDRWSVIATLLSTGHFDLGQLCRERSAGWLQSKLELSGNGAEQSHTAKCMLVLIQRYITVNAIAPHPPIGNVIDVKAVDSYVRLLRLVREYPERADVVGARGIMGRVIWVLHQLSTTYRWNEDEEIAIGPVARIISGIVSAKRPVTPKMRARLLKLCARFPTLQHFKPYVEGLPKSARNG